MVEACDFLTTRGDCRNPQGCSCRVIKSQGIQIATLKAENERLHMEEEENFSRMQSRIHDLERALAERAGGVKVRALEWCDITLSKPIRTADTEIGKYQIESRRFGVFWWRFAREFQGETNSLEAAKSAAQADYERRVLSCITTDPAAPRPMNGDDVQRVFTALPEAELAVLREIDPDTWGHPPSAPEECTSCGGTGTDCDAINPATMTYSECEVCYGHGVVSPTSATPNQSLGNSEHLPAAPVAPIEHRNDDAGYIEYINEDVPVIAREFPVSSVEVLLDMESRHVVGYRLYDEPEGRQEAVEYAERLACTLHAKHWSNDAPQWKPLSGDLIGILTQIDNMTAALTRPAEQAVTEEGAEIAARLITKWLGFSWDGLFEGNVTDKGFPIFTHGQFGWGFQGRKGDMTDLAREILIAALAQKEAGE